MVNVIVRRTCVAVASFLVAGLVLSVVLKLAKRPLQQPAVMQDVVYNQKLASFCTGDIHIPALSEGALAPAVIVVHGGSWTAGSKNGPDTAPIVERLVDKGFIVFDINYRLQNQGGAFPHNVDDVKSAIQFLSQSAPNYCIDAKNLAVVGVSSGGQLALLAAYDPQIGKHYVNSVVAIAPATDLTKLGNPLVTLLFPKEQQPAKRLDASPISHVQNGISTLLIHGTSDPVMPIEQSKELEDALNNAHVPVRFEPIAGADHGFITRAGEQQDQALSLITQFLVTQLNAY